MRLERAVGRDKSTSRPSWPERLRVKGRCVSRPGDGEGERSSAWTFSTRPTGVNIDRGVMVLSKLGDEH